MLPNKGAPPGRGHRGAEKPESRAGAQAMAQLTPRNRQRLVARLDELADLDRLVREVGTLHEPEVCRG